MKNSESLLRAYSQDQDVRDELLAYTKLRFGASSFSLPVSFPLPDEPYITTWETYLEYVEEVGVYGLLQEQLAQFCFPIQKGISQTEAYRSAMLKGKPPADIPEATGLALTKPEALELSIHESLAGHVLVLSVYDDGDFKKVVQALAGRNEPISVPKSMGAAMISGVNNWNRIRQLKANWLAQHPGGDWSHQFRQHLMPHPALYQDKLIVLSRKPYSNVAAEEMELSPERWLDYSMIIRLEHECAHLFTLRYFGCMTNNMHDELLADYMGITRIAGNFRAAWFLRFVGLEAHPRYRSGARLENYLGEPPLSARAFSVLQKIVYEAAIQVERFDRSLGPPQSTVDRSRRLLSLAGLSLVHIAAKDGAEQLRQIYQAQLAGL
jgi:hypothetical protein